MYPELRYTGLFTEQDYGLDEVLKIQHHILNNIKNLFDPGACILDSTLK